MLRAVWVRQYVSAMAARGHSPEKVLAGTGLTVEKMRQRDALIEIGQARAVASNVIKLSGDQGIGLEIGSRTEVMDFGPVGYLMMSAATAREAVQHWMDYSNTLVGTLAILHLEEHGPASWSLSFDTFGGGDFLFNMFVEEQLVIIYQKSGSLTNSKSVMTALELSYPAPAHERLYHGYFQGPIRFNSARTRISFSQPRMDDKIRGNDPEFHEICKRQCERLVQQIGLASPLVSDIRNILMRARGRSLDLEYVAHELTMNPRKLRRTLQAEGISYRSLVADFRAGLAKEYLRSVSISTKEIAYSLGFDDTNSFRRAFKLWEGMTVHEYRARHGGQTGIAEAERN